MTESIGPQPLFEEKLRRYEAVVDAANAVRYRPVWPQKGDADESPESLYDTLFAAAQPAWLLAPADVTAVLSALVRSAYALTDVVVRIRRDSKEGHGGSIALPFHDEYAAVIAGLDAAITEMVRAVRTQLEVDGQRFTVARWWRSLRRAPVPAPTPLPDRRPSGSWPSSP